MFNIMLSRIVGCLGAIAITVIAIHGGLALGWPSWTTGAVLGIALAAVLAVVIDLADQAKRAQEELRYYRRRFDQIFPSGNPL